MHADDTARAAVQRHNDRGHRDGNGYDAFSRPLQPNYLAALIFDVYLCSGCILGKEKARGTLAHRSQLRGQSRLQTGFRLIP